MKIERRWSMPNKWTFRIKPIKELLQQEMTDGLWIDPYAGESSPATITNDLNPERPTDYHLQAIDFLKMFDSESVDGVSYIVAKTGLLIAAVIFPYKVVNETFVTRLEEVTRECRRVLDAPPARTLERDTEQGNMFQE